MEYRAFVRDSKLLGIANYYPQRALPDTPATHSQVQQVEQLTQRLVAHLDAAGQYPWMVSYERGFKPRTVNATLDFLVTQDGVVVLLEAGPPFGAGAHPCSFLDQPISGLALGLAPGVKLR